MQKWWLYFTIAVITIGCGDNEEEGLEGKTVFRYNEEAGISSLDPAFARNFENIAAINQVFNGLVQMDDSLNIIPCIARRWEISEDGLVYTFYLRDDVYFHDSPVFPNGKGRKVAATDFMYSFYRIINPRVASPGAWIFNEVDFTEKTNYNGFSAPNDTTLHIYLKNPFPPFLGILTMQYCSVVPHEAIEKYSTDFRSRPVGTGPFQFKAWQEGSKLILVKNPVYFEKENGRRLPYLDAVAVSFVKDRHSEFLTFIRGDFDMIPGVDASYKNELLTPEGKLNEKYSEDIEIQTIPFLNTHYLGILVDEKLDIVKNSPLRLKEVRQALNYGFNRQEMIRYLRNNIGTPATSGFVPQGLPSFSAEDVPGYRYDPDKARELLAKAGFPKGKNLPEITLSTASAYLDLAEFMQNQLREIGINIKIEVLPVTIHTDLVARAQLNLFRKSWVADYPDAENYLALFYSKNFSPMGPNYTHFKNDVYDMLYEKAKNMVNDSARYELYRQMDRIIIEEAPVVPLYYDRAVKFYRKNITGFTMNPMNLLNLKRVKKVQE